MKFQMSVALTLLCAILASAQRSFIGSPAEGATVSLGSTITVQVVRPNSIQGSREVGLAIGLLSCPITNPFPCPPPSSQLGTVLYTGPFNPQLHEMPGRPYQNFSIVIPADGGSIQKGRAQLSVSRFHLIGAGPSPVLEFNNLTLNVV